MYNNLPTHIAVLAIFFLLSSCYPWIKRINITQGNIVETTQLHKLQPGISREQVRFVLGTPIVSNPFSNHVWQYYYSNRDTLNQQTQYIVNVYFEDDRYTQYTVHGDLLDITQEKKHQK